MSTPTRFRHTSHRQSTGTDLAAAGARGGLFLLLLLTLLGVAPTGVLSQEKDDEKPLPLEVGRTARIDLTEGTWMSVDVSPDGSTLVFDYLGDLFTLPMEGGDATQLTSGMAFDAQPRFSPDGEWIVFTSDRDGGQNIWRMRTDLTDTVQVSEGKSNRAEGPEWTPDGEYIVASMGDFRGRHQPRLHIWHAEGGSGTKLVDEPEGVKTLGPAFGDDGRWIWFAHRTGERDWDYNAQLPQYQLAVYDRETGEVYGRSSRWGSGFRPTLSPDGRWLVYGTRWEDDTGLVLRELATGEERWLAYPVQHDDQESRATMDVLPGMSFTPDSRHLVTTYGGKLWSIPVGGGEPVEIPFRVDFELQMGPEVDFDYPIEDTPTFTVQQIRDAVPSPDGSRIAFTAMDRLWIAEADGSNPRRLTDLEMTEHFPAWSPDGRWIAYATWDDGVGALHRARSDGSGLPQRLTERTGLFLTPAWSPDGERIVAMRGIAREFRESAGPFAALAGGDEVVWLPAGGGEVTLVAPSDGRTDPHFVSERPDRIYLQRGSTLVSIRFDGTDEKEHVKVEGPTPAGSSNPLTPSVLRMAPVGDQALALIQHHVYTVTVPFVGGDVPTISVASPGSAPFPARQLTEVGGEFPAWGADGRTIHWSLGNAHFVYELDRAEAFEDSVEAAARAEEQEEEDQEEEGTEEAGDEEEEEDARYRAREFRILIEAERDIPRGTALLAGARIVTMVGDEVIEEGDVLVVDNRIEAVGASGTLDVPDDAEVIDVSGHTIVPGFVDTHAHMWPAWGLHRPDQWIYLANLAYGVTTTRDPQTATTDVLSYADRVTAGELIGPRVYSTGPGVFWQDMIGSLDDARDRLSAYSEYFDTKTIKMYVAGNRQQRQWILMAARELGLMPTTEGSLNLKQNLNETIDGYPGLEHSVPVYPVYDDVKRLFVETGRVYTPTLLVSYGGPWAENWFFETEEVYTDEKLRRFTPTEELMSMTRRRSSWFSEEEHVFQDHARFVADLVAAGGKAGVGSHGQLQGLGYHWELWAMAAGGMPPHDALEVATLHGAEAIGLDGDIGTVEAGKLADLVVLRENPLDDLRNTNTIRYVMKNGRLYDGDTLDEIHPRRRVLDPLWWWSVAPEPETLPGVGGR